MKIKNVSNYPVTVNGIRIDTGESKDLEIEDEDYYRSDRRFKLEDDDEQPESEADEGESEDEEISKSEEQNKDNTGDN